MQIGSFLHELWRRRIGAGFCLLFAVLMAIWSIYSVSLAPPGLHKRALEIGAASTQVLVDAPRSNVVNLAAQSSDFGAMTTRADLLSNVMASTPVRAFIARRAGIPVQAIAAQASLGENLPRSSFEPDSERRASDLLKESDKYRISIKVNPTLPVIYVDAQGPSASGAARLANASVAGLRDYLAIISTQQRLSPKRQARLIQLGTAQGGLVNGGVGIEIALLTFAVAFAAACAALFFFTRVRRGWNDSDVTEERGAGGWWPSLVEPEPSMMGPSRSAHDPD